MNRVAMNMVGQKFNKLTVLEFIGKRGDEPYVRCLCDCGNEHEARAYIVKRGQTKSCGRCQTITDEGAHMRCTVSSGRWFIFDKEDYDIVNSQRWFITAGGYVTTGRGTEGQMLARLLLNAPDDLKVNHINGIFWDNRRENLRLADHQQCSATGKMKKSNKSGFKGVHRHKTNGNYVACISPHGRSIHLGVFDTAEEAAAAYDVAAVEYFGEFADTNERRLRREAELLELGNQ